MARFRFDGAGIFDYPFIGLTAFPQGVAELVNAPDAYWTEMPADTPVTIQPYGNHPYLSEYQEPANGSIYVYDDVANRPSFRPAGEVFAEFAGDVSSVAGKTGDVELEKADVGLDRVDNTSDLEKPISDDTATALAAKANALDVSNAIAAAVNNVIPEAGTTGQVLTKDGAGSKWSDAPAAVVPDATASVKGSIRLAGDLSGTAADPTVPGLGNKLDKADNLAALADKAVARSNLELGTAATADSTAFDAAGAGTAAATSAVNGHKAATDPHGDRAYADGLISSNLNGVKLQKITQAAYDALGTKDSNTLYIII